MASLAWLRVPVAAFAVLAVAAAAQQANPVDPGVQFSTLWFNGAYLEAIEAIEGTWENDPRLESRYLQNRPALDGFVVLPQRLREPAPPADTAKLARYDGAVAADAIAEIVERAKTTRIVILNEAHDNPRDRAFVLAVAEALRPLGYTHYAAEALNNGPNDEQKAERLRRLTAEGYPRRDTGTYSSEPMFGWLLRSAVRLGYQPVAYEFVLPPNGWQTYSALPREGQIAYREREQAGNLARAIAEAGPEAKFLIHVGYSHAAERPIGPPGQQEEWMAARLARLTGIDPLTIDQTDLSEFADRGLHAALAPRLDGRPAVFRANGRPVAVGAYAEAVDLQVVHPPIATVGGRPDWLQRTGRQAVAIPAELLPASGRRLIQAFVEGEAAEAVPVDQALVRAGEAPPVIYIPAGMAIRWAVQDGG
jgi:hypothetical protein